jgi:hypothetical protein
MFRFMTQSQQLSEKLRALTIGGRRLNDDSKTSERVVKDAVSTTVFEYAKRRLPAATIDYRAQVSLWECQQAFAKACPTAAAPDTANRAFTMKPDGGVIFATIGERRFPLLIVEDKVQGTNDLLYAQQKPRQATGNAIERAAKNIRMCEMLCADMPVFPYVVFAAGCDFHPSESIYKRIEAMNYGRPSHHCLVGPAEDVQKQVDDIIAAINITNAGSFRCATFCIKSHKYNEMPHGASAWTREEVASICCRVIDLVTEAMNIVP